MIQIKNVSKTFDTADGVVEALRNVSLTISDGDIFGIIGMSGAGKSTLVRCINLLEQPSQGSVEIDGCDLGALSEVQLREMRRKITMIFQGFNLLMQRSCLKNVCFPLELIGVDPTKSEQKALDPTTTNSILELIRSINEQLGITVVIITHQMSVIENVCKHVAILDNGKVVEQGEVSEVFSRPRSVAAKRMMFPELDMDVSGISTVGEHLIRVVFNGTAATGAPIIARMAVQEGIEANILYASTKSIGGRSYGSMLLGIQRERGELMRAITYLTKVPDILVEEVS